MRRDQPAVSVSFLKHCVCPMGDETPWPSFEGDSTEVLALSAQERQGH